MKSIPTTLPSISQQSSTLMSLLAGHPPPSINQIVHLAVAELP